MSTKYFRTHLFAKSVAGTQILINPHFYAHRITLPRCVNILRKTGRVGSSRVGSGCYGAVVLDGKQWQTIKVLSHQKLGFGKEYFPNTLPQCGTVIPLKSLVSDFSP